MLANHEQMITIMTAMMPEKVADHLISKHEGKDTTTDEMENYLSKMEITIIVYCDE